MASARRWLKHGICYVTAFNQLVLLRYACGSTPEEPAPAVERPAPREGEFSRMYRERKERERPGSMATDSRQARSAPCLSSSPRSARPFEDKGYTLPFGVSERSFTCSL